MEKMYKIKEVAEELGVERRKVSLLIHSGYLKAINNNPKGKRPSYRIMRSDFERYLKENKIK